MWLYDYDTRAPLREVDGPEIHLFYDLLEYTRDPEQRAERYVEGRHFGIPERRVYVSWRYTGS